MYLRKSTGVRRMLNKFEAAVKAIFARTVA
jgi:hypothetical protein